MLSDQFLAQFFRSIAVAQISREMRDGARVSPASLRTGQASFSPGLVITGTGGKN